MSEHPLCIIAGKAAYRELEHNGWEPSKFTSLIGASGGAKFLGLAHLDRLLFGDFLQRTDHPMSLYGSSIGSWRHAALASPNPLQSITKLQDRYLNQQWDEDDPRTPREIVDSLCEWVIDGFIDEQTSTSICDHPRFTTHIVTTRGRGLAGRQNRIALGTGMALGAIGNLVSRRILALSFQRVVFTAGIQHTFEFLDFQTHHVKLKSEVVRDALLASASIPFLMSGQRDISGAPKGHYWDGGIVDYHFDFVNFRDDGLALYPHFGNQVIKGWFDKSLPWRRNSPNLLDRVVILLPSASYLAYLPYRKIPDRKDFAAMSHAGRMKYWQHAVDASRQLAEAFEKVIDMSNPVANVTRL